MAKNKLIAEMILEYRKMQSGLNKVGKMVNDFSANSGKSGGQSLAKSIGKGLKVGAAFIAVALVAAVAAAAALAGAAAGKIIAQGVKAAAENERFQMRFEILTGSRGAGNAVLKTLREDALRTGVALSDMADNVGKFMAFGFSGDEALDLNRGILDVGGAVGLTTRDMKLLGVALSQVKAKGVASMEELRQQIAEKGIPIFAALEEQLGVNGEQLSKMIQEGRVSADTVMDLFKGAAKGEGPFAKFAGGAEKMAQTFEGRVNVIKRNWEEFLRVFGQPIKDSLMPILIAIQGLMVKLRTQAEGLGTAIANMFTGIIAVAQTLMSMDWEMIGMLVKAGLILAFKSAANFGRKVMMGVIFFAIQHFKNMATLLSEIANEFTKPKTWAALGSALTGIALNFFSLLMNNLASFVRAMKESSVVLAKILGDSDETLENIAKGADIGAGIAFGAADSLGNDSMDRIQAVISQNITDAMDAFKRGFEGEGDFYDTSEQMRVMQPFLDEIRKNYEELKRQREKLTEEANQSGKGDGSDGAKNAGTGSFGVNSRLSQAMNVIGGGNQFEAVASAQAETKKAVEEGNKTAAKIEQNTRPKKKRPEPATVLPASHGGQDFSNFA